MAKTKPASNQSETYRLTEAAAVLGLKYEKARILALEGHLPGARKLGGTWLINKQKVHEFIG